MKASLMRFQLPLQVTPNAAFRNAPLMAGDVQFALGGIEMVVEHSLRSYLVLSAVGFGVGVGGTGCAGRLQQSHPPRDEMRDSVAMVDSQPRMLLAGPARLLHVQVDKRRGSVTLFRVPRQYGTSADCRAVPEQREIVLAAAKATSIDIGAGEIVCARVDRKARLSWHATARKSEFLEPPGTLYQASLLP